MNILILNKKSILDLIIGISLFITKIKSFLVMILLEKFSYKKY